MKPRMDGVIKGKGKDIDLSKILPEWKNKMDERTTIYNDDFSMDYGNLEDDNNVDNEENPIYTDNLEYNGQPKMPIKNIIIAIIVIITFGFLVTHKASNKIDIEKYRLKNLEEIETKTTSLSDEILILKEQLLLKQAEKVRLIECLEENREVGKYADCKLYVK